MGAKDAPLEAQVAAPFATDLSPDAAGKSRQPLGITTLAGKPANRHGGASY